MHRCRADDGSASNSIFPNLQLRIHPSSGLQGRASAVGARNLGQTSKLLEVFNRSRPMHRGLFGPILDRNAARNIPKSIRGVTP
jgi:hypothetical protein